MNLHSRSVFARDITVKGMIINTVLCAAKFAAGVLGRSSAMVADAVHSLSDSLTDIVVIVSLKFSSRPADSEHAYGHGRFETLATLVIAVALFAVGAKILYNGILDIVRLAEGGTIARPHAIALWMAVLSIIVKEWLYRYTLKAAKQIGSSALEANAWHHRSDAMSSIGTLLGIGGAYFLGNKWTVLDPLAAVVVSFFIFEVSWNVLKTAVGELLDKSLGTQAETKIAQICRQAEPSACAHSIKTRKIGGYACVEFHVYLPDEWNLKRVHDATDKMEHALQQSFGPQTLVTIHPEPQSLDKHH